MLEWGTRYDLLLVQLPMGLCRVQLLITLNSLWPTPALELRTQAISGTGLFYQTAVYMDGVQVSSRRHNWTNKYKSNAEAVMTHSIISFNTFSLVSMNLKYPLIIIKKNYIRPGSNHTKCDKFQFSMQTILSHIWEFI